MKRVTAGSFVSLNGVTELLEKWRLQYFDDEMGGAAGVDTFDERWGEESTGA